MTSKIKFVTFIVATIVATMFFVFPLSKREGKLIGPEFNKASDPKDLAAPSPAPTPKTFKFDASTDLEMELEKIDPQILESDFELFT